MDFRTIGGKQLIKSFTDNFHRGTVAYIGNQYIAAMAFGAGQALTTTFAITTNQLSIQDSTANQTQFYPECFVPIVGAPNLNGVSQFAKTTWASGNNITGTRSLHAGVAVLISINSTLGFSCYTLEMQDETANQNIIARKFTQSGGYTTLFTSTAGDAPNTSPHTFELAAVPGATSTTLKIFLDGVLLNTTVDSSTPIITGVPGFCRPLYASSGSSGLAVSTFSAFSVGPGQ